MDSQNKTIIDVKKILIVLTDLTTVKLVTLTTKLVKYVLKELSWRKKKK